MPNACIKLESSEFGARGVLIERTELLPPRGDGGALAEADGASNGFSAARAAKSVAKSPARDPAGVTEPAGGVAELKSSSTMSATIVFGVGGGPTPGGAEGAETAAIGGPAGEVGTCTAVTGDCVVAATATVVPAGTADVVSLETVGCAAAVATGAASTMLAGAVGVEETTAVAAILTDVATVETVVETRGEVEPPAGSAVL